MPWCGSTYSAKARGARGARRAREARLSRHPIIARNTGRTLRKMSFRHCQLTILIINISIMSVSFYLLSIKPQL